MEIKRLVRVLTVATASSQETEDGNAAASSAPDNGEAAEASDEGPDDPQEQQDDSPPAGKDAQQMVRCLQSNSRNGTTGTGLKRSSALGSDLGFVS